jgi:hypothetical protein
MLLIKIPTFHMSLEKFVYVGIYLKIKEKAHPLIQGEKPQRNTHRHMDITWIGRPTT